jgi:hypothetical protein
MRPEFARAPIAQRLVRVASWYVRIHALSSRGACSKLTKSCCWRHSSFKLPFSTAEARASRQHSPPPAVAESRVLTRLNSEGGSVRELGCNSNRSKAVRERTPSGASARRLIPRPPPIPLACDHAVPAPAARPQCFLADASWGICLAGGISATLPLEIFQPDELRPVLLPPAVESGLPAQFRHPDWRSACRPFWICLQFLRDLTLWYIRVIHSRHRLSSGSMAQAF